MKLEAVVRMHRGSSPGDFSTHVLDALQAWQASSRAQEDDITLVVIDVV